MDEATIISLCTAGAGAITAFIVIITKWQEVVEKHMALKEKREQKKQEKLSAKQAQLVEAMNIAIKPAIGDIKASLLDLSQQLDEVRQGMNKQNTTLMYLVKDNINCAHKKFVGQGYIDRYSLDIVEHLFNSYEALGGNSFVGDLMEDIRSLPIK